MSTPSLRRVLVTGGSGFIGSHLVRALAQSGAAVANFDRADPVATSDSDRFFPGDVTDSRALEAALEVFAPTAVVHLAARVDIDGETVADYVENTEGTENLLRATKQAGVRRTMVVSTQFVCSPGHVPERDDDYSPFTAYGESKVVAERMTRSAGLGDWVIVRPTTIWGPGDLRYRSQFYAVMRRGLYFHPRTEPVLRSYGYVGNVVDQMIRLLSAPADVVARRTLYVGDPPIPVVDFANEFSRQMRGVEVRQVPAWMVRGLALIGDLTKLVRMPFPISTQRYRSMTESYPVPLEPTLEITGPPPFSLADGVRTTIEWLESSS